MGRKSKAQKQEEEGSLKEGIEFLEWLYSVLASPQKTERFTRDIEEMGKFMEAQIRILQGKDDGSRT